MFRSEQKIQLETPKFTNSGSGQLIAPVIQINNLILDVNNLDQGIRAFFEFKGAKIRQMQENGKNYIHMSGNFTVTQEECSRFLSQRNTNNTNTDNFLGYNQHQNLRGRTIENTAEVISVLNQCKTNVDGNQLPAPELALRRAANAGRLDLVQKLVNNVKDLNINEPGPTSGKTALDFAEEKGHLVIVEFLKAQGAKSKLSASAV